MINEFLHESSAVEQAGCRTDVDDGIAIAFKRRQVLRRASDHFDAFENEFIIEAVQIDGLGIWFTIHSRIVNCIALVSFAAFYDTHDIDPRALVIFIGRGATTPAEHREASEVAETAGG